jgi:hypothetical protein
LFNGNSDNPVEKGVDDNHRENPETPGKTRNAQIMELSEVVNENTSEVCDFSDELSNIVALFPSDMTMSGSTPSCPLLDFLIEGVSKGSVKIIEDLRNMVFELDQSQIVGSGHGPVMDDSGHPLGDNLLATVRQKI